MKIYLIRHGRTLGNEQSRYIGVTDEGLSESGRDALFKVQVPSVQGVFVSPMLRCRQTANILFPKQEAVVVEDLRECNFGDFENKNYKELAGNKDYQAWIDSGGTLAFPHGERVEDFKSRTLKAFKEALRLAKQSSYQEIALVVHGGSIMTIMEAYEGGDYYSYQVTNGQMLTLQLEEERI